MHQTVFIDQLHPKRLLETVKSHNTSKLECFGTNGALSYLQKCHKKVGRNCKFNIIDCACIDAYIIHSEVTGQSLTRK